MNSAGIEGGDGRDKAALISAADIMKDCWEDVDRDRVAGVMEDKVKPIYSAAKATMWGG